MIDRNILFYRYVIFPASGFRFWLPILLPASGSGFWFRHPVLASGAGAESRIAIGTVVIGGLLCAGVLTLFLTPVLYDLMARFTRPRGFIEERLAEELDATKPGEAVPQPGE